jgi:general secretion pathway protein D
MALVASGCAAGSAMHQGDVASQQGDLDGAVAFYRRANQSDANNPTYQIALQRAMQAASRAHLDRAKAFEDQDQLEAARGEYRMASEYDPSNRFAELKVSAIDRIIRERIEATRPRPFQDMQQRARANSPVPLLNPTSREPITLTTTNTAIRDIINTLANSVGINVTFDRDLENAGPQGVQRQASVQIDGLTIEQALNQVMMTNTLSYKVLAPRQILVFPDTAAKHLALDDQVIQTFPISNANPTELAALLSQLVRPTGIGVQPQVTPGANNTIVARATVPMMQIIAKIIEVNDKPPAEVVIDVEILEVNRTRAKQYGLDLSQYAIGAVLSPNAAPGSTTTGTTTTPTATTAAPGPISLNQLGRVGSQDLYLTIPSALVRFLESDTQTKLVAKPQLRGTEGTKLLLRLGDKIPLPSTTFTPIATGGASTNPLTTFTYTDVGVNLDMTPRVTVEGDIVLDLVVENSSLGANIVVNGVSSPTIGTRSVTSRLRLRDGESNLLAGLLREDERKVLSGFPGAIHLPFLKQLFSSNDNSIAQTDIVMLLTPHIVRSKEITEEDLRGIFVGAGVNWSLGGPPPLIAVPDAGTGAPADATPAGPSPAPQPGGGGVRLDTPAGGSPVPGAAATPTAVLPAPTPPTVGVRPPAVPPNSAGPTPAVSGDAATTSGLGSATVVLTPPTLPIQVGGGPYNVPITVSNAVGLTTISITVAFDPQRLRVRSVQEGSFMRSGGVNATFAQQVSPGRVDITITRANDTAGASGTGLLGSLLVEPTGPGTVPITISGFASGPGGTPMGLQLRPATIMVQP